MDNSLMGAAGSPAPTAAERMYATPQRPAIEAPTFEIADLRASDGPAALMYSADKQFGNAPRALAEAVNVKGTEATLAQQAANFSFAAKDMGMSQAQIEKLAAIARSATANGPMTAEALRTAELQSVKQLRDQYGKDFDAAFSAARALAQRDPRVKAFLDYGGIGSRPEVVQMFAELGIAQRRAGRLK